MPLSRQLIVVVSAMYLLVFAGTFTINLVNTRDYLVAQLESHAQDAATSLGLSLSPHLDDALLMESMVDAMFDRGYYREIVVEDVEGASLIERSLAVKVFGVPDWFVGMLPLPTPRQSAKLMAGWRQGGNVRVRSHPGFAYDKLWSDAVDTFWWSLLSLLAAIVMTKVLLHFVLRSLRDVESQALAVADREFPRVEKIPRTREFRRVVLAMNRMTGKVEQMLSEQHERVERLREAAYVDAATGLGNQRAFERDLDRLVTHEEEYQFGGLALVRVQGLDAVNREHGYEGGDELLASAAGALSTFLEGHDADAARLGGSLYAVILPGLIRSDAEHLLEGLLKAFGEVEVRGRPLAGANIGFAYYGGGQSTEALVKRAEEALRNAEESGVNTWHLWDATETAAGRDLSHEQRWRAIIERVIADRAVVLFVQPVFDHTLASEYHREVLARIRPEGGELVSAGLFLPMAARVGLTAALDRAIIEAALSGLAGEGREAMRFAINLSRQAVEDDEFLAWLAGQFSLWPEIGQRLAFEVTEQVAASRPDAVLRLSDTVRGEGARFGVDHCGARDLALDYMKRLKAEYSKVDGSFIRGLPGDEERQAYLRSLVEIGHALDITLIAEQVETREELDAVRSLGFDAVQGHLAGVPEPLA